MVEWLHGLRLIKMSSELYAVRQKKKQQEGDLLLSAAVRIISIELNRVLRLVWEK